MVIKYLECPMIVYSSSQTLNIYTKEGHWRNHGHKVGGRIRAPRRAEARSPKGWKWGWGVVLGEGQPTPSAPGKVSGGTL